MGDLTPFSEKKHQGTVLPNLEFRQRKWNRNVFCQNVHVHLYMYIVYCMSTENVFSDCTCITINLRFLVEYGYSV